VRVTSSNTGLQVWGQYRLDDNCNPIAAIDGAGNAISGQNLNVDVASGSYNLMAREFWNASNQTPARALDDEDKQIYSTSDAVVHLIDGALIYSTDQLTSWADEVQKAIDDANAGSSRRK
jgi:non-ribosomal peptide synthetase component F